MCHPAPTIDYELSKVLPQTLLPHLCIGMDSLGNMKSKPTIATLSASGAGQPIFMHSNPNHLYQMLYGGISTGDIRQQFEARSNLLDRVEQLAAAEGNIASRRGPTALRSIRPGIQRCQRSSRSSRYGCRPFAQVRAQGGRAIHQSGVRNGLARCQLGSRHLGAHVRNHQYADHRVRSW